MTMEIGLLFGILGTALVLFSLEWISAEVVGLGVVLALVLTGILTTDQAFAGFGSDTVMMILGLLICSAGLLRTGVVEMAGRVILRVSGDRANRLLVLVVIAVAVLSAFISNTAATAFFLPIALGVAQRASINPSKLLMPLAFASILTSSVTLVSTSTNIVVSGLMKQLGMAPMGMFELAPVGIPVAVVGIAYVLTLGKRLLPAHAEEAASHVGTFGLGPYLTEVLILPGSKLIGKTLAESGLGRDLDLTVVNVIREKTRYLPPTAGTVLEEGDVLLVEGKREDVLKVKDVAGIDIKADVKLADPQLRGGDLTLVEVILLPRSPLLGRTLKGYRFRERYRLQVLAIHRHRETLTQKISDVRLRLGDVLMLQGDRNVIRGLEGDSGFRILGEIGGDRPMVRRAPRAIAIFVLALGLATAKVLPLPVATLAGALAMFLTGCITPQEAWREIEWKALILVGSMLALGVAMAETGAAAYLASWVVRLLGDSGPRMVLAAFFTITVVLTQPMSNQAAATVVVPVAVQTALQLGFDPRTLVMGIAVAASCSYLTPLEPSCLMVYGPGGYRFRDFLKVGALLTVIIGLIAVWLVPLVWPP